MILYSIRRGRLFLSTKVVVVCVQPVNLEIYMKAENSLLTAGNVVTTVLLTIASDRLYIDESPLFYVVGACTVFLLISVLNRIVK
jgi:hypothetical protein